MEIAAAPALGRRRGDAARRRGPPGRLHARPGRPAGRLGRPGRHHRGQRLGQVDAAGARCSAGCRWTRAAPALGPGVVVGEIDQARALFLGEQPLLDAFDAACPTWCRRTSGPCWRSSGCGPAHVLRRGGDAVARRAHPGRARAAAGPRREPAGPRRADQPPRPARHRATRVGRWPTTRARLLLVTHDRRMLDAVPTNRHINVDHGQVTEY